MDHDLDAAPVAVGGYLGGVPVIDLNAPDAAARIFAAARDWGFFQIVGHDLPDGAIDRMRAAAAALFAEPRAAKRAFARSADNPWGYYDSELTKTRRDKKEIFDAPIGLSSAGDTPFTEHVEWPPVPDFREAFMSYGAECARLANRLVSIIATGLGAQPDALAGAFEPEHSSFLRLNHYPTEDPLAGEAADQADLGIHHHTDAGALTLLLQGDVPGLQVYRDGCWTVVEPVHNAFVINIGDMLQVWSNDRLKAPIHRVAAMTDRARSTAAYFHNPSYRTTIQPLAAAIGGEGARYEPFTWGEFRRRRADGDFANYGTEVQISDWALAAA